MKVWFTSDTHFYHENIIRFCNRPYWQLEGGDRAAAPDRVPDMDWMNTDMVNKWNARVRPHDIVYHLGDFCFGSPTKWNSILDRLNGRIILIQGNHDHKNLQNVQVKSRFMEIHEELYTVEDCSLEEWHPGFLRYTNNEVRLWLNHYPAKGAEADDRGFVRPEPSQPYDIALCGHVHTAWKSHSGIINVGSDMWGFQPISLEEIVEYRNKLSVID